jgi:hypothetical protein
MAAAVLAHDVLRRASATPRVERAVRSVIGLEESGAAPRGGRRVTRLTGRKGDT